MLISNGVSFGGDTSQPRPAEPVKPARPKHPAIAPLLAAIAALESGHCRKAVDRLEEAMDVIGEHDGLMNEF